MFRSRGIDCHGTSGYRLKNRKEWLEKLDSGGPVGQKQFALPRSNLLGHEATCLVAKQLAWSRSNIDLSRSNLLGREAILICREATLICHEATLICHEATLICHETTLICHETNLWSQN
jgi:hypothetical protein